jgi:hypothetical protein
MNATLWTINEIKDAVRATGSHWFDPGTMRFFGSRIGETVYQGPGGIYFITSEKPPHTQRAYTVRQFTPPGDIDTIGEVASMGRSEAIREAKRLAAMTLADQLMAAMVALDDAVIDNPTTTDKANQYSNGLSLEQIAEGGIVYMQDGGYTRWTAHQYDTGGYYLQLTETGATDRKKAWSDAYKLQREVCRVLWTFASNATGEPAEQAEAFKPISDAEQFLDECRQHGNTDADAYDCRRLASLGVQHHKIMEDYCNGRDPHDAEGEPKSPLRNVRASITAIAHQIGAKGVKFSGDPRGCTVKLLWHNGETNDWGKEGWCVPGA